VVSRPPRFLIGPAEDIPPSNPSVNSASITVPAGTGATANMNLRPAPLWATQTATESDLGLAQVQSLPGKVYWHW
jgi:hypothetical protein